MPRLRMSLTGAALSAVLVGGVAGAETPNVAPFDQNLKLARSGDIAAQIEVARAYEDGVGTGIDRVEAAKWYRKAADHGNPEAMFRLARIVGAGAPGIKKNLELAAKLYEAAARLNHAEAQNWLGYSYQHGLGIRQSDANALEWYKKAAASGLSIAQNNLGLMYLNGKGVARDYAKAFTLFEQAAKQGDAWAINNLGGLYEMGWGVEQDRRKALASYKQAFEKGNANAGENMKRLAAAVGSEAATASVDPIPDPLAPEKTGEVMVVAPKPGEKPKAASLEPPPEKLETKSIEPPPTPEKAKAASLGRPPLPRPRPKRRLPSRPKEETATESALKTSEQASPAIEVEPAPKPRSQNRFNNGASCRPSQFKRFAAGQMRPCDYF